MPASAARASTHGRSASPAAAASTPRPITTGTAAVAPTETSPTTSETPKTDR